MIEPHISLAYFFPKDFSQNSRASSLTILNSGVYLPANKTKYSIDDLGYQMTFFKHSLELGEHVAEHQCQLVEIPAEVRLFVLHGLLNDV